VHPPSHPPAPPTPQRFPDCFLLELTGDETPELRKLMMKWKIKTTPTFFMYRGGEKIATVNGTSDNK
jgi:thioredoxin-related protein